MIPKLRTPLLLLATLAPLTGLRAQEGAQEPVGEVVEDLWMTCRIEGVKVGYTHMLVRRLPEEDAGRYLVDSEFLMVMKRLGTETRIRAESRTKESAAGEILEVESLLELAEHPIHFQGTVVGEEMQTVSGTRNREEEGSIEWQVGVMSERRIYELAQQLAVEPDGTEATYLTFDPTVGKIYEIAMRVGGKETIKVDGEKVEATQVFSEAEIMPGMTSVFWVHPERGILRLRQPMLGNVDLVLEPATREEALAEETSPLPDVFVKSVVGCDMRIPHPSEVDEALYRLVLRKEDVTLPDFAADTRQLVAEDDDGTLLLRVSRRVPEAGAVLLPIQDLPEELQPALEPNSAIQSDEPALVAKAREIIGEETDAWRVAQLLEKWVYGHISKKTMGVAFASAAEVFEDATGDCTEHAVLLAAMCRAAGIPARVAMGVTYFNGVFGGHAWTEVWIGDWYALDGTLAYGSVDATHITLATGEMDEETGLGSFTSLGGLLGAVDLEVLELRFGDRTFEVGNLDELYTVEDDAYRSELLGIAFRRPPGWSWDNLDDAGMSSRIAEIEGEDRRDEIEVHVMAVPYAFTLEDFVAEMRKTRPELSDASELTVDGRRALRVYELWGEGGVREGVIVQVGDSLYSFRGRFDDMEERQVLDAFLETVDFDLGLSGGKR